MPGDAARLRLGLQQHVLNNAVVIATAFDLTGDAKYRDGALQAMDYIFGRNALNQSYVTGYGETSTPQPAQPLLRPPARPERCRTRPPGSLAGGPNAALQDPYAQSAARGLRSRCSATSTTSSRTSTNEVAINWNSALAWIASFLADQGDGQAPAPGRCKVTYINHGSWGAGGGWTGQVLVTNTGTTPIDGWTLRFAFSGDQRVRESWMARVSQDGATVTAKNESYNGRLEPGGQATFGFTGLTAGVVNPPPGLFTLNGGACG